MVFQFLKVNPHGIYIRSSPVRSIRCDFDNMSVDLGFIDKSNKVLNSRYFLSKIGGKPSWLDLKNLPLVEEIVCEKCQSQMLFLCQLYSPSEESVNTFHRTLFVFLCINKNCFAPNSNTNFCVFRSQLPRCNRYYPDTPPPDSFEDSEKVKLSKWSLDINPSKFDTQICNLCGCRAHMQGRKNPFFWFCSENHDENFVRHEYSSNRFVLPEFGLSIEPEYTSDDELDDESNSEEIPDLTTIGTAQDDPLVDEIFKECSEYALSKAFRAFKSRISESPDQVIRYGRSTQPLWLSDEHVPNDKDIPSCEYCNSKRVFEFQILPQLLNFLKIDEDSNFSSGILDWGVLTVYTCENSCNNGPAYKKEFLWKQDLT